MFDRIAVFGVGAIGSVIGAYLSKNDHDPLLIDTWADHVDVMNDSGLCVTAVGDEFTTNVKAMHLGDMAMVEPFDLIFLAMKSYDTVWSANLLKNYLKPGGVIVSAQNGVNDDTIASVVGYSNVIGLVITIGAGIYDPGHVHRTSVLSRPAFALGELNGIKTARIERLREIMDNVGPSKVTTNLWGERWAKLATNCMSNSLAALTGLGSAAIRQEPGVVDQYVKIGSEVVSVGIRMGLEVEPINGIPADLYNKALMDQEVMEEVKTRLAEGASQLGDGRPSMAQDLLKGRKTEIQYLNGYVVSTGLGIGVEAPVNERMTQLIQRMEQGSLEPAVENIEHLQL
ncbi:MAG: 2-dehydropantoate 2-reductase [Chloroflexota bacterium]|nr:2-dehydropantoate 2-reductase [Chloroflexota bacterium]